MAKCFGSRFATSNEKSQSPSVNCIAAVYKSSTRVFVAKFPVACCCSPSPVTPPTCHAAGTVANQWENTHKNNNKQYNTETNWPCYRCLVFNQHKMTKAVTEWLKFYRIQTQLNPCMEIHTKLSIVTNTQYISITHITLRDRLKFNFVTVPKLVSFVLVMAIIQKAVSAYFLLRPKLRPGFNCR